MSATREPIENAPKTHNILGWDGIELRWIWWCEHCYPENLKGQYAGWVVDTIDKWGQASVDAVAPTHWMLPEPPKPIQGPS